CLKVLAWVVGVLGFVSSIFLAIAASALLPKIYILLGSFVATALFVVMLLATSKFIYLFIDIEGHLSELVGLIKKKPGD
ncbi:unnamed protein product, partial [marine sediment metagenome]